MENEDRYDVALSFSGEERAYVERVWTRLKANRFKVFYDEDPEVKARHSGSRFLEVAKRVYSTAEFVVMFVSESFVAKNWPSYECSTIANRMFKTFYRNTGVIIGRFDSAELTDIPSDIWYEDLTRYYPNPDRFAKYLVTLITSRRRIDQDTIMYMFSYNDLDNIVRIMNGCLDRNLNTSDSLFAYYSLACALARQSDVKAGFENLRACIHLMSAHRSSDMTKFIASMNSDDDLLVVRTIYARELAGILHIKRSEINIAKTGQNAFDTFVPRGGGCVDTRSSILTPSGCVPLGNVLVGSEIMSLSDRDGGFICKSTVLGKRSSFSEKRLILNGKLIVSPTQPLFERALGWIDAADLLMGLSVLKFDKTFERVHSIEEAGSGEVTILSISDDSRTFIANEFVCHNMKF